eukprot:scaffold48223_cov31-Tisochrysis_lutea.AAC.3
MAGVSVRIDSVSISGPRPGVCCLPAWPFVVLRVRMRTSGHGGDGGVAVRYWAAGCSMLNGQWRPCICM